MKEPSYVMKVMATYSGLSVVDNSKDTKRVFQDPSGGGEKQLSFTYTESFYNHFHFRHSMDDHNNLRHATPSIEETWFTHRWANRVFAFLLAITEVNCYLAFRYFVWKTDEAPFLLEFRRMLSWALINNEFYIRDQETVDKGTRKRVLEHNLATAPTHTRKYQRGKWEKSSKATYQKFICQGLGCKKQVRTYCQCSVGEWLCTSCHLQHVLDQHNN